MCMHVCVACRYCCVLYNRPTLLSTLVSSMNSSLKRALVYRNFRTFSTPRTANDHFKRLKRYSSLSTPLAPLSPPPPRPLTPLLDSLCFHTRTTMHSLLTGQILILLQPPSSTRSQSSRVPLYPSWCHTFDPSPSLSADHS